MLEGVMMRGKTAMATSCRDDEGNIQTEATRLNPPENQPTFLRFPFVRGVVNLLFSLVTGTKILMRSAEVYVGMEDEEEEPSKFEKWLAKTFKIDIMSIVTTLSLVLGVVIAIGLFVFLPYLFSTLISTWTGLDDQSVWFNLIEGGFRIAVFIAYIALTSLMKDIRRTYMYHGAEHKTITCFERGLPLTVENVRGCKRVHDRCGTTFMFLVMVIAILVFSISNSDISPFLTIENSVLKFIVRLAIKLALLPVVAGVSYEVLRLLAKTQSPLVYPLKLPGLALQHLTTREPDDDQIECAIAAFNRVLAMDADRTIGESSFAIGGSLKDVREHIDELFERAGIEGDDCLWILSLNLDMPLSEVSVSGDRLVTAKEARAIYKMVNERLTGKPLWYIVGDTSFCGYTVKVDQRALIPRPETEVLVEQALKEIKDEAAVLDLCTGSGAIAVATYKLCNKTGKKIKVTASDISVEALTLARQNAAENNAEITFIHSDLFENINPTEKFDVILSNPPYIPAKEIETLQREVKDFEPNLALDGGEDGLSFYRRIAADYKKYLKPNGFVLMEVGMGQANDVKALFAGDSVEVEILQDLAGIDRIVKIKNKE